MKVQAFSAARSDRPVDEEASAYISAPLGEEGDEFLIETVTFIGETKRANVLAGAILPAESLTITVKL